MLSIIAAKSENNVIGNNNTIPWNIPEDLKRFKEITMGKKIIMGRKTFESLPFVLPRRKHIVLSKNENFKVIHRDVEIYHNLDEVINKYKSSDEEVFIIGGGELYSKALKDVDKFYITNVLGNFSGDSFFPSVDFVALNLIYASEDFQSNNLKYNFRTYIR